MPNTGPSVRRPKAKKRTSKMPAVANSRRAAPANGGVNHEYDEDDGDDDDALGYMNRRHNPQALDEASDDSGESEVEEVMALKGVGSDDDDDDEDDEDDDEDDEDDEENMTGSGLKKLSDSEDDDDDDDDEEDSRPGALGWGGKRTDLYGGHEEAEDDSEDISDDERAEKLEELEALKLQRAHAARLRAEDFGDLEAAASGGKKGRKGSQGDAGGGEDEVLSRQLADELAELPYALRGAGGVSVEAVARDMSGLSEAEIARAVEADAPELLHLLGDFKETLREAREKVAPLVAAARQRQLPPDGGLRLLQVKLQLMLSYATNLAFYLLLKAQGRTVREHPVIDALLKHRILLERIRPLEAKSSYRLQKLLQLASASEAEGGLSATQKDLAERPNPDALLNKSGGARAVAGAADDDDEGDEDGVVDGDGLYRPPKMAAVPYDEESGSSKRERQRERALARAASSRMVRELRSELSDAPVTIHADDFGTSVDTDSAAVARFRKEENERRKYEEDNFKRLVPTKDEKRQQRRRAAAASGVSVDELSTFDDFSHLYNTAKGANERPADPNEERMRALQQYMNSIEQRGGANKGGRANKHGGADDDAPQRTRDERSAKLAKRQARQAEMEDEAGGGGGGGGGGGDDEYDAYLSGMGGAGSGKRNGNGKRRAPMPDEDPFYAEVAAQQKQRKQGKAERRAAEEESSREALRAAPTDQATEGEGRKVGRQIEKNRGLTRQRKKEDANPRVKNREKFRKAVIRRNGQVRTVQVTSDGPYGGELTGIKKNVSHSTRF
jgi:U3 small nucleolar RNA-associated protein 3